VAAIALAGSIHPASATRLKTSLTEKPAPLTLNLAQTPPKVQPDQTQQLSKGTLPLHSMQTMDLSRIPPRILRFYPDRGEAVVSGGQDLSALP